jgi:hypothetical protein
MEYIDDLVRDEKFVEAFDACLNGNYINIARVINKAILNDNEELEKKVEDKILMNKNKKKERIIRVFLCCDWATSDSLCDAFNKQSKGNYTWENICIVSSLPADYYVIFNKPPNEIVESQLDFKKTILLRMEPHMEESTYRWGKWANPDRKQFLFAGFHDTYLNTIEYHISKTYNQLMSEKIVKNPNCMISTVLSTKMNYPGHIKRINFVKFLESKDFQIDVFGNGDLGWKQYKGSLPYQCKDDALMPYFYTFNAENNVIDNYITEKLIDGILCECLTFYYGSKNVSKYIDPQAYVQLDLEDFETDYKKICDTILNSEYEKRLEAIRREKVKILNELQFFPRIAKILNDYENEDKIYE